MGQFYALLSAFHNRCIHQSSSCNVLTGFLTTFATLYFSSLGLMYFIPESVYVFIPFICVTYLPTLSALANASLFSIFQSLFSVCLFVCFVFWILRIREIIQCVCVFLSLTWFTSITEYYSAMKKSGILSFVTCCYIIIIILRHGSNSGVIFFLPASGGWPIGGDQ